MFTPQFNECPRERGAISGHVMTEAEKIEMDRREYADYRFGRIQIEVSLAPLPQRLRIADSGPINYEPVPAAWMIWSLPGAEPSGPASARLH